MIEKYTLRNNKEPKNYVELAEQQVLEKIKKDIIPIQENLAEKKITVEKAKVELKKINEWLQWSNIEQEDKKNLWDAFDNLNEEVQQTENQSESLISWIEWLIKMIDQIREDKEKETKFSIKLFRKENNDLAHKITQSRDYDPDAWKWRTESDRKIKNQFTYAAKHETGPAWLFAKAIDKLLNS